MAVRTRARRRLIRSEGWQAHFRLRAQEGRSYAFNQEADLLLLALRAPRHSPIRRRLPAMLEDFRRQAKDLEQRTLDFALGMPVEFFAEYRARRRSLGAVENALARLSAQDAAQAVEPPLRALAIYYEWLNRRAADYLRPQLDELDDLLARAGR